MKQREIPDAADNGSSDERGREFAARRRVLKGLVAVPVAVTLSNGAALAGSSSQCYLKMPPEAADNEEYCIRTDDDTVWSRSGYVKNRQNTEYCIDYVDDTGADIVPAIDQNGKPVRPDGMDRHPLTISCATSFL